MRRALIGYTGFVGSNLLTQGHFSHLYRSTTITDIVGQEFDEIVCAAAPAEKWRANQDPMVDQQSIKKLCDCLATVRTDRLVLVSTVDVFGTPVAVDEECTPDHIPGNHYGNHRRQLESFASCHFPTLVVRLPGLYGRGLKKNVIFDLMNDHRIEHINRDSEFQFYDVSNLWRHVRMAQSAGLSLVHLAPPPVSVDLIARAAFQRELPLPPARSIPVKYDLRTRHAGIFGGGGDYICDVDEVLFSIRLLASAQRVRQCA
jgi:nucleoside-diphosphate-sugar epimerase